MREKNWAKVADDQFNQLPADYQEDWKSLRDHVDKRHGWATKKKT